MPSFYGPFSACDCYTLTRTIGPPPQFRLPAPPQLPLDILVDLGLSDFKPLKCQISNSSLTKPSVISAATESNVLSSGIPQSHPILFITIVFIVLLIVLLLFFIFIAMLLVRIARIKLMANTNTNDKTGGKTASNRSYLISNSGASNNSNSSLSSISSTSRKEVANKTRQSRDQFLSHQHFYPEVLTSSSACNSTESSSASPKSSNLNSSYLTELDHQFQFIKPTCPAPVAGNKLVNSSTSSSFCDSQSFLISNASNSHHFTSFHTNNQRPLIPVENSQNQYESIPDLTNCQQYFNDQRQPACPAPQYPMTLNVMSTLAYNNRRYLPPCHCYGNQHMPDCSIFIQQQIDMFNRANNAGNEPEGTYLNSLIV